MRKHHVAAVFAVLTIATSTANADPILGMIDTFQSGTTERWFAGGGPLGQVPPVPPQVVDTGGPTGANDAFLQVTSQGGSGSGSRLVAMNSTQWTGAFTGIPTIEMDVINLGALDLTLRLQFWSIDGGSLTDAAITSGATVAAGGGWTHVAFAIDAASLTAVLGTVDDALTNVAVMRLMHNVGADLDADPIAAILGVDNISAGFVARPGPYNPPATVPEPGTLLLVATGLTAFLRRGRHR